MMCMIIYNFCSGVGAAGGFVLYFFFFFFFGSPSLSFSFSLSLSLPFLRFNFGMAPFVLIPFLSSMSFIEYINLAPPCLITCSGFFLLTRGPCIWMIECAICILAPPYHTIMSRHLASWHVYSPYRKPPREPNPLRTEET
ncbi:hypothetical protein ASPCADRAFT_135543 [Aspergillus carbonarius ITEM 5010]|uniref:Uncharacterized protein n=1 Tax=Aspergillus carbonarius (strain ITEM 5010) TaxID=602072 RepID=A0A1R3R676_ASPC5|nr:hypothetical protein ASPCADRAFT_135543 [Aspergillus carbonarius ITEM 5010]